MKIAISLLVVFAIATIFPCVLLGQGTIEHHKIKSDILAEAKQVSERELSVYLPPEYYESGLSYPVLYLIHGWTGDNRTFLGKGYPSLGGLIGDIYINEVMDNIISNGRAKPMIVVLPNFNRSTAAVIPNYETYLTKEIIPFIDETYRTLPIRESRIIAGHSVGGNDAFLHISL